MERHPGFAGWCRTCKGPCKQEYPNDRDWTPVTPDQPAWWVFWGIVWIGTFVMISLAIALVRWAV